jgi:membrane fusion protein (multidrug efflux system)
MSHSPYMAVGTFLCEPRTLTSSTRFPEKMNGATSVDEPHGRHGRLGRYLLVALGLVMLVALLAGVKAAQISKLMKMGKKMEQAGPPPEAVGSAPARAEAWEATLSAVGTIASLRSVAVSNELAGTVSSIRFRSGDVAREGQVLVELDADVERAQAASMRARRDLARRNLARSRVLARGEVLSRQQLDQAQAEAAAAETDLAAMEGVLTRKVVRAPFAGRLGIRAVNVGQYLPPGTTVTTVDAVEPPYVDFALPQEELPSLRVGQPVRVTVEGTKKTLDGTISAIEPTVDPSTRNIRIRATVPAGAARPGMFVDVDVVRPKAQQLTIVPATAVIRSPYGDSVFIVERKKAGSPGMSTTPDGKTVMVARQQFVRLGPQRGDFAAIAKGVTPGQRVVTAGAFKLRNNTPIVVDDRAQARPQLEPHPENR